MACTAQDLQQRMNAFSGGSTDRYRHTLNRKFIYTAGVQQAAEFAGAYWLLDIIAFKMVKLYATAWLEGTAGIGIVELTVYTQAERIALGPDSKVVAKVTLSLEDDAPPAFEETLEFTDFPEGKWQFYLGTDEAPDGYVSTLCLPQEY